jgi:hypothetical protein
LAEVGTTLRHTRQQKGLALEDAEHVTRIPRKYLIALEEEDYSVLPAPVYARGFLRSYASYLGLDPGDLMPLFPVRNPRGEEDELRLEPLSRVRRPVRRASRSPSLLVVGAVGLLLLALFGIYGLGRAGNSSPLAGPGETEAPGATVPQAVTGGQIGGLPDFAGRNVGEAVRDLEDLGASYVIIGIGEADTPRGQVVDQAPGPGQELKSGQTVNLVVSR